jgi:hypothetical protein
MHVIWPVSADDPTRKCLVPLVSNIHLQRLFVLFPHSRDSGLPDMLLEPLKL